MFEDDNIIDLNQILKRPREKTPDLEIDFDPRRKFVPEPNKEQISITDEFLPATPKTSNLSHLSALGLLVGLISLFLPWKVMDDKGYSALFMPSCWIFFVPFIICFYAIGKKTDKSRNYSLVFLLLALSILILRIGNLWGIGYVLCLLAYVMIAVGYAYQTKEEYNG